MWRGGHDPPPHPPARPSQERAGVGGDVACRGAACVGESVIPRRPLSILGCGGGGFARVPFDGKNRMSALHLSTKRTACVSARPSRGWGQGVVTPPPHPPTRPSLERAGAGGDAACRGAACAGESVTPRRLPVYLRGVALGLRASYCWINRMSALCLSTKRTACVRGRPSKGVGGRGS